MADVVQNTERLLTTDGWSVSCAATRVLPWVNHESKSSWITAWKGIPTIGGANAVHGSAPSWGARRGWRLPALLAAGEGSMAALSVFVLFAIVNGVGFLLWTVRHRLRLWNALMLLVLVCGGTSGAAVYNPRPSGVVGGPSGLLGRDGLLGHCRPCIWQCFLSCSLQSRMKTDTGAES